MRRSLMLRSIAALALGAVALTGTAQAQRDPAYSAARAAGQIGEKMDGYLGFVASPSPSLKAIVDDLNIKRKAVYVDRAQAQHATVEEYSMSAGCTNITRTVPGEKYQAPDGSWATRGADAPQRDSRCP